jgi:hypothetical protein
VRYLFCCVVLQDVRLTQGDVFYLALSLIGACCKKVINNDEIARNMNDLPDSLANAKDANGEPYGKRWWFTDGTADH